MIVHIILGKARDGLSDGEAQRLSETLSSLGDIAGVEWMTWGVNSSERSKGYTHGAVLHFAGVDALDRYQIDKIHVEAVQTLNELMPERLIVDYETDSSGIST